MKTTLSLRIITGSLVILSIILIYQSSRRMSITIDEPNHYFCGLQWWQDGEYTSWPENPVFSRIVTAAGPYLAGYRADGFDPKGDEITIMNHFFNSYRMEYFHDKSIENPLLLARIFVLPIFLLSIIVVWFWSRRLSGELGGFIAVGVYAFTPLLMGHAGLATTDITFVSAFTILIWLFYRWLNKSSMLNGLWFGIALAFAMLSKFSVFPFFGITMIVSFIFKWLLDDNFKIKSFGKWLKGWIYSGMLATVVMSLIIWAFYGFHIGALGAQPVIKTMIAQEILPESLNSIILPAPEWFAGIVLLFVHNSLGMKSYMLGEISPTGFWYFYPVGLTIKTPVTSLLLGLFGIAGLIKGIRKGMNWEIAATFFIPFTMMASVMSSNINIGVRHIASVYPLFAVGATASTIFLLSKVSDEWKLRIKYTAISLVVAQILIALIAFPNYTNYFNFMAGKYPGKIMADSDLGWGQGLIELSKYADEENIDEMYLSYFGIADECLYDLPAIKPLPHNKKVKGWIAISENNYWGVFDFAADNFSNAEKCRPLQLTVPDLNEPHNYYRWLDSYEPVARVGGSILIYYIQ